MNYRRGFQRIYAVCTALWIALVVAISIPDQPPNGDFEVHLANGTILHFPPGTDPAVIDTIAKRHSQQGASEPSAVIFLDKDGYPIARSLLGPFQARIQYWALRSGIALVPTAVLYILLFLVIPWIHRGFRPEANV
jgi:hypothetical protein